MPINNKPDDKTADRTAVSKPLVAKTADAVAADATAGTYTVAPGRHVSDADGSHGPGESCKLDEKDAKRMLALGFILDTDGTIVVRADGPAVNVEDGVQIAQPA